LRSNKNIQQCEDPRGCWWALDIHRMSDRLAGLYETLKLNGVAVDDLPAWVAEIAFACVDESTIDEIVRLLARAKGAANQVFWRKVHNAPHTDEGWRSLLYAGGELADEDAEEIKKRDRRTIELIRLRFPDQERVVALFRK
jgi:hypothetical protein